MPYHRTNDAVVEITSTVRFKVWVNQDMIDSSGEYSLEGIASEYLGLHVNDHPTIQADMVGNEAVQVLSTGDFVTEAVMCATCGSFYFKAADVDFINEHSACRECPEPELEED